MPVIHTEIAMEHLRVDDELEKTMVEGYLSAAEDAAMEFLDRRFYADEQVLVAAVEDGSAGERPMVIRPSVQSAVLLILGGLYAHRGDDSAGGAIPKQARWLLEPFRTGMGA